MSWIGPAELGRLLDRHGPALLLFARQWCDAAEDVVQEAFVRLIRQAPPPDNAAAWLFRVVRNGAISASRSDQRRRKHEALSAFERRGWFETTPDAALDVESATRALAGLPLDQREIVVAHVWGEMTFQQIGELTGLATTTAFRRYEQALGALRERLGIACPRK